MNALVVPSIYKNNISRKNIEGEIIIEISAYYKPFTKHSASQKWVSNAGNCGSASRTASAYGLRTVYNKPHADRSVSWGSSYCSV